MTAFLDDLYDEHSAARTQYGGTLVVSSFGDKVAEWKALDGGAGLVDLDYRCSLWVSGEERRDYLHGQLSADIRGMENGRGCASLLLNAQGRALSYLAVFDAGDRLLITVDAHLLERTMEGLERFLVADDCEFEEAEPAPHIGLAGPDAPAVLRALGMEIRAEPGWGVRPAKLAGQDVLVTRRADFRVPGFEVIVADADGNVGDGAAVWKELQRAGAMPAGLDAVDCLRVESGMPLYGVDYDENRLALEARTEWAIHFAKGCYVGQEVIERTVSRGKLKRCLHLLQPAEPVRPGVQLDGGGEKDVVTSVVASPGRGLLAFAYGPSSLEPGAKVSLTETDGRLVEAEVLEWPRPRVLTGRENG